MNPNDEIICCKCNHYHDGYCDYCEKEVYQSNWCYEHSGIPF